MEGFLKNINGFNLDSITLFLILLMLLGVTIFFLSNTVRNHFELSFTHIICAAILSILLLLIKEINPIKDTSRLNMYYLEFSEEEKWRFDDSLYTGIVFTNHQNGTLNAEGRAVDGLENGTWKYYNEKGGFTEERTYERGILEGKDVVYFPSGELKEKAFYKNDLLDGDYEFWFTPTKIQTKGRYKWGKKQGEWKTYELSSFVVKIEIFDKGQLQETNYSD